MGPNCHPEALDGWQAQTLTLSDANRKHLHWPRGEGKGPDSHLLATRDESEYKLGENEIVKPCLVFLVYVTGILMIWYLLVSLF